MNTLRFFSLRRVSLPMLHALTHTLLVALLLAIFTSPAWAGGWTLDHYEYSGTYRGDLQGMPWPAGGPAFTRQLKGRSFNAAGITPDDHPVVVSKVIRKWEGNAFDEGTDIQYFRSDYAVLGNLFVAGHAINRTSVCAVFKWNRNRIRSDSFDFEGTPDPNDNPPQYVYLYESGRASMYRFNTRASAPYTGQEFTVQAFDCDVPGAGQSIDGGTTNYLQTIQGDGILKFPTAGMKKTGDQADELFGPTRHFYLEATCPNPALPVGQGELKCSLQTHYQVSLMQMDISMRRHGSTLPIVDVQQNILNNQASIAAGAKGATPDDPGTQLHWMDVYITLAPPLSGQKLSIKPGIGLPPGVKESAYWKPNPDAVTDGSGRALIGWMRSNDRLDGAPFSLSVPPYHTHNSGSSTLRFQQRWDESTPDDPDLSESHWTYDKAFDYDTDINVTFKPAFEDRATDFSTPWPFSPIHEIVHITKHTLNFMVGRMKVTGIDASHPDGGTQTWTFTSNPDDIRPNMNPVMTLISQADLDRYAPPKNGITDGNGTGVYTTTLKVPTPPKNADDQCVMTLGTLTIVDASVEQIWMKAQDNDVYVAP